MSLLNKAGFEVILPKKLDDQCCGMPYDSKGMTDLAQSKAQQLEEVLWQASRQGEYPVLMDTSPCAKRSIEQFTKPLEVLEPTGFVNQYLLEHLTLEPLQETVMLHVTCSSRRMGLACIGIDERPALPGLGNIRMIDRQSGLRTRQPVVDFCDHVAMGNVHAHIGQQPAPDLQNPVDIQRRRHIGLNLGDHIGHRQRDHIAGIVVIEPHARCVNGAHMHAGRADRGTGRVRIAGIDARAKRGHHHIDKAETDRRSRQKPGFPGRFRA